MENKMKNVLSGIGFYGTLAVCLLVVGVCGWVLLQDREDPLPQQAVTPQVPVSQPVEMPEVRLPTVETLEPAPVPVPPKETKELPEVEVDHTPVAAEAPRLVVAPLRGDVLTAFSMEELVYSPTLGDWRTHNGVDIAAQQGTTVLAASAGAVLSVTDDPLMGTTVVLEHDNGYQTTYANLQAKPNVEAGDPVSAGQIIGAHRSADGGFHREGSRAEAGSDDDAGGDRRQAEDQLPEKRGCRRGGTSAERQGGTGEVFCCRPGCVR